jgi:PAS domain S-box-containing protein
MDKPLIQLLLIEDSASDARLVCEMLRNARHVKINVETRDRLAPGLERLAQGGIEVVLLDLTLPDSQGLDTFLEVHRHAPQTPVIILSGFRSQELATRAVAEGAQDYLFKEYSDADLLERSIRYAIERQRIRDALQEKTRMLQTILDGMAEGVIVVSAQGQVLEANPAAQRLTGLHVGDAVSGNGQTARIWFLADRATPQPADQSPLSKAQHGQSTRDEQVFVRADGLPDGALVTVDCLPLCDKNNQPCGGVVLLRTL